jgi:hypothetical protein
VRRKLAITCLFLAWFCANGALWDVVQVVAWGRMFASYSTRLSPLRALEETFDASRPCALCVAVHKAQDTARKQLPRDAALGGGTERLLLISEGTPAVVLTAPESSWPGAVDDAGLTRVDSVPVPPPRV